MLGFTTGTERAYTAFLGEQLKVPNVAILVAMRGADVLGYTYAAIEGINYLTLRGPAGLLHDLVVDPNHRGQGIGRMLLDATVAELKSRGAPRVVLSTRSCSSPPRKWSRCPRASRSRPKRSHRRRDSRPAGRE